MGLNEEGILGREREREGGLRKKLGGLKVTWG